MPGTSNTLADFLSHSFHLDDAAVCARLQCLAPIQPPWRLVTQLASIISMTNCALSKKMLSEQFLTDAPPVQPRLGPSGQTSALVFPVIPSSKTLTTPCRPLLQIFAARYCVGTLAPSQSAVRSRTVEDALHAVGQTLASMGYPDPRLQASGKLDFHLQQQLQGYAKQDPPPSRVKPVPLQIILHIVTTCYNTTDAFTNAIGHMLTLGFFFLLRPGECAATSNPNAAPF